MYVIVMMAVSFVGAMIFAIASYLGFFLSLETRDIQSQPITVLYDDHMGPYHESVTTLLKVETWAKANSVSCSRTFGLYLDNPDTTDADRLRSKVGCITDSAPASSPFKSENIPARRVLQVIFRGSPAIGPIKVYPEAQDWMKDNKVSVSGPVLEMHDVHEDGSMTTTYHFPIGPTH